MSGRVVCGIVAAALLLAALAWASVRDARRENAELDQSGHDAGRLGQPPEACPYSEYAYPYRRSHWMRGWLRGDAARRAGCGRTHLAPASPGGD